MIKTRFFSTILFGFVFFFSSFINNNTEIQLKNKFIVVLDAGHGGHDPGNLGNGFLEKDIALAIVLEIGKVLEKNPDIKVIYTRDDDTFIDLFKRGEIANQANADLFVSVHCDSHNSDAYGAGTFVLGLHANKQNFEVAKKENSVIYLEDNYEQKYAEYDINSPESIIGLTIMQEEFLDQSIELAKLLQTNFTVRLKRKDRKVKQAGFIVLHQTFMPSVLIETGFLTNKNEGSYLDSERGKKEMGTAIANAILSYKDGVEANLEPISIIEKTNSTNEEAKIVEKTSEPAEKENTEKTREVIVQEVEKQSEIASNDTGKPVEETEKTDIATAEDVPIIIYKVQLMASSKAVPLDAKNFRGLDSISKESFKNLYRYMYGNAKSYEQAKLLKSKADAKGYTTSYIVAYKEGMRIPLKEALK
ncbi:N-acetylmuramoyl-L-alanine amidase family protein [Croceitalea rosinachiae]|uniref:N-acetylmuramoyl-L-alanine amidase n=1 Tax=Croceitalea rosinachiae TaxID=3075596 RepID=A0ABU3AE24_9FLAO|nr:N-acetylmuramoyl-L-alanine amidase [Croceitalea sp. F388]MDT0608440.1 N-acetylmuramoyl-L-alanine amidase [Croceitalea sp. F388]